MRRLTSLDMLKFLSLLLNSFHAIHDITYL
jgi:hypothetical protein